MVMEVVLVQIGANVRTNLSVMTVTLRCVMVYLEIRLPFVLAMVTVSMKIVVIAMSDIPVCNANIPFVLELSLPVLPFVLEMARVLLLPSVIAQKNIPALFVIFRFVFLFLAIRIPSVATMEIVMLQMYAIVPLAIMVHSANIQFVLELFPLKRMFAPVKEHATK